jgi:hypothetical protein
MDIASSKSRTDFASRAFSTLKPFIFPWNSDCRSREFLAKS